MNLSVIRPDWPAPANVSAFTTTRVGGFSTGPWKSMNLGLTCGDDPLAVLKNRETLNQVLPAPPQWLRQVHGTRLVEHSGCPEVEPQADAIMSGEVGQVCAVLTADCLPVFFCDTGGDQVAVAHAGWRGLANGVLEATVHSMQARPDQIMAWFGPAIGPTAYEVGEDVKTAFEPEASTCLAVHGDRWRLDLYAAARCRLERLNLGAVFGGDYCTFIDEQRFFSYRRDGVTGRMASLIWLEATNSSVGQ